MTQGYQGEDPATEPTAQLSTGQLSTGLQSTEQQSPEQQPTEQQSTEPQSTQQQSAQSTQQQSTEPQSDGASAAEPGMPTIWEQLGGPMGLVDSGLPVVVFVAVNAIAGLGWGIGAAVAAALVIAIFRLVRGRPVTQAISGLLGVGVAAFIAYRTGSAKNYFLLGIWSYVIYGAALLLSILVRWPLVGVLWEGINGRGSAWRKNRGLVRKYDLATGVWVLVFALRFLVQNQLYDSDKVGWLATARLLMGYPLFIVAIVVTVLIVGSAAGMRLPGRLQRRRPDQPAADQPAADQPDTDQPDTVQPATARPAADQPAAHRHERTDPA